MSVLTAAAIEETATGRAWPRPLGCGPLRPRPDLSALELEGLRHLGTNLRRRRGCVRDVPQWSAVARLLRPLDDARVGLWCPDTPHHRRAITDAIGLVLLRCAETNSSYWAWSSEDWLRLIGRNVDASSRRRGRAGIDANRPPLLASYAYLLGGFTDFHRLGPFNRLTWPGAVFGKAPVEESRGRHVARSWAAGATGSAEARHQRLPTVLCQAFLLNRSPLLEDMGTEAVRAATAGPGDSDLAVGPLWGIQSPWLPSGSASRRRTRARAG